MELATTPEQSATSNFVTRETWGVVAHPKRSGTRLAVEKLRQSAEVVVAYTSPVHPGGDQTVRLLDQGVSRLFVIGGDGTVAACADALITWIDTHKPERMPRLTPIPAGTANVFWRNLQSLAPAGHGAVDVDVATVTLNPGNITTTSLVAVGAGNSVRAISRTPAQAGWWSYIAMGLRLGTRIPAGSRTWTDEIGNVEGVPGRLRVFDTDVVSGSLCRTTFAPHNLVDWVRAGAWALGADVASEALQTRTGPVFELSSRDGIHVDGEVYIKARHARVEIRPRALPVHV